MKSLFTVKLFMSLGVLGLYTTAAAEELFWTGSGDTHLWSNSENWRSGKVPVSGDLLRFDTATQTELENDLQNLTFGGLSWLGTAPAYSLSGNEIGLSGTLSNLSSFQQTLDLPLRVDANLVVDTVQPILFSQPLSYKQGLSSETWFIKNGTNEWVFTGTSVISNNKARIRLDDGTIRFKKDARFYLGGNAASTRYVVRVAGDVENKETRMVVEPGAHVELDGFTVQGKSGNQFYLDVDGEFVLTGSDNTFGDSGMKAITLTIGETGSFSALNGGYLSLGTRVPMVTEINGGQMLVDGLSFGRQNNTGDRNGGNTLRLNRGLLRVQRYFGTMSTFEPAVENRLYIGDGTREGATFQTVGFSRASSTGFFGLYLNGGVMECMNGSYNYFANPDVVEVLEGGAILKTESDLWSSTPFLHGSTLAAGVKDGGFTKRGAGAVAFTSAESCTFDGPIRVEGGMVRFSCGLGQNAWYAKPGTTLSFRGSQRQILNPESVYLAGTSDSPVTLELDALSDGTEPDIVYFPAGSYFGKMAVRFCLRNADGIFSPITAPGDYPLFIYTDTYPNLKDLSVVGLPANLSGSFVHDMAGKRILLSLRAKVDSTQWAVSGSGDWETDANWSQGVPASGDGAGAAFLDSITADSSVTLSTPWQISALRFNHSYGYSLIGSGVLSLGMKDGETAGAVYSDAGSHTIATPLSFLSPVTFTVGADSLTLSGSLSGSSPLAKQGSGTLRFTETALESFPGSVSLEKGTIAVEGGVTKGSWSVTGVSTLKATSGNTSLAGLSLAADVTLDVQEGASFSLSDGIQNWPHNTKMKKTGNGSMVFSGTTKDVSVARYLNMEDGSLVFAPASKTEILNGARNSLRIGQNSALGNPSVYVQSNAVVRLGGIWLNPPESVSTLKNSSLFIDGTLEVFKGEVSLSNKRDASGDVYIRKGGSLQALHSLTSIGIYGSTLFEIDGGVARFNRVTLTGYGDFLGSGNRYGTGTVIVRDNGLFEVTDSLMLIVDNVGNPALLQAETGGVISIPALRRPTGSKGTATLLLDGGTLRCLGFLGKSPDGTPEATATDYLYGIDRFLVGANGAEIDSGTEDITITQMLSTTNTFVSGASLRKTGSGKLTLSGGVGCALPIEIVSGTLALPEFSAAVTVASGAKLSISDGSVGTVSIPSLSLNANAKIEMDVGDTIVLDGDLSVGGAVSMTLAGTHQVKTWQIISNSSLSGMNLTGWTILNPKPGFSYQFSADGTGITLSITSVEGAHWGVDADGQWSAAANWVGSVLPGMNQYVLFDTPFSATRTVTLSGETSAAGLVFAAGNPVVLSGGSIRVDNGTDAGQIQVKNSDVTIQSSLLPPADASRPLSLLLTPDSSLALQSDLSGNNALSVLGGGTLVVAATNRMAQTKVSDSTLKFLDATAQEGSLELANATVSVQGNSTISGDVSLEGASVFSVDDGQKLMHSGTIVGNGSLAKTGSGEYAVSAESAFTGDIQLNGGVLRMSAPHKGRYLLNRGMLSLTGMSPSVITALLSAEGAGDNGLILNHEGDVTLESVSIPSTSVLKTGPGTLTIKGSGQQILAKSSLRGPVDSKVVLDPSGAFPTSGTYAFDVLEGTVVLDSATADYQIPNGHLVIGRWTADAPEREKEAHVVMNAGTLDATVIMIGRGNGNTQTAPTPLASSFTLNAGEVTVSGISMGHDSGISNYNGMPQITINGGSLTINNTVDQSRLNIAESFGANARYLQTAGDVDLGKGILVGLKSPGGNAEIRMEGGTCEADVINLGYSTASTGTLWLAGGKVRSDTIVVGNGKGVIHFDGGELDVISGPLPSEIDSFVHEGGAIFNINSSRYTLDTVLFSAAAQDGGVIKRGKGLLAFGGIGTVDNQYNGPTVVEEGGLAIRSLNHNALPTGTTLRVKEDGWLALSTFDVGLTNVITVAQAEIDGEIHFQAGVNSLCDQLHVTGELSFGANASVTLTGIGMEEPLRLPGTYSLFRFGGSAPSLTSLSVNNPVEGLSYQFFIEGDEVKVQVSGTPTGGAQNAWAVDADGLWSVSNHWSLGVLPGETDHAVLGEVSTAPRTVSIPEAVAVNQITFNHILGYTLNGDGTLTLGGGVSGLAGLNVSAGTHYIDLPLSLTAPLQMNFNTVRYPTLVLSAPVSGKESVSASGKGWIELKNGLTFDPALELRGVSLNVRDDAIVKGPVSVKSGAINASSGTGTLAGSVALPSGVSVFSPGATLCMSGPVLGAAALEKSGSGTLRLEGKNGYDGTTTIKSGLLSLGGEGTLGQGTLVMNGGIFGSHGTTPVTVDNPVSLLSALIVQTEAPLTLLGDLAVTGNQGVTKRGTNELAFVGDWKFPSTFNTRFWLDDGYIRVAPGSRLVYENSGSPTSVQDTDRAQFTTSGAGLRMGLTIEKGGYAAFQSMFIQRSGSPEGRRFELNLNGGTLDLLWDNQSLALGDAQGADISVSVLGGLLRTTKGAWADLGTRSPLRMTIDEGGEILLGRAAFGRQSSPGTDRFGGGVTLDIRDGRFAARRFFSFQSTSDPAMTNLVVIGAGSSSTNARFCIPASKRYSNAGYAKIRFDGGVLETLDPSGLESWEAGDKKNFLYGVDRIEVGLGGAAVDTAGATVTIRQPFYPAEEVLPGGFTKHGLGQLTLAAPYALPGLVTVSEGTLTTALSMTNDLSLATGGTFDLSAATNSDQGTVGLLSGSGTVTNGTVYVTKGISPGDGNEINTVHAESLALNEGATIYCDRTTDGDNDKIAVSGNLSLQGGVIDFKRDLTSPLTIPFTGVLGTYGQMEGKLGIWKAIGTGNQTAAPLPVILEAKEGVLHFTVRYGGTILILH